MRDAIEVFSKDTYTTAVNKAGFMSRLFPSIGFFTRVAYIVYKEGRKAEKQPYSSEDWVRSSLEVVDALEVCGVKIHVDGLMNSINLTEPCVYIANHMSTLETFVLPSMIQSHKDVTFVVKESLLRYPIFGAVMRSRNPIAVSRTNPRQDLAAVLDGGVERLKSGISVIVFPQSTRSNYIDSEKFNTIGIKLAKKADVPVVPVALRTDAWAAGGIIKELSMIRPERPVHFSFGEPMRVTGNGKLEHAEIVEYIQNKLTSWDMPKLAE